jgi:hypothetical protein
MNEQGRITPDALVGITTTDNAGRYRIENVEPGRYGLIAGAVGAPTYYPGTDQANEARVLSLASGTATTGMDFTLAAPPSLSRGTLPSHIDVFDLPDEASLLAYLTMLVTRRGQSGLEPTDLRIVRPGEQPTPSTLDFALTAVEGRVVSFVGLKGGTLRSDCDECSFLVGESGIVDPSSAPDAGIIFKLSLDRKSLTATCRATECLIVSGTDTISRITTTQTIPAVGPIYFRVKK